MRGILYFDIFKSLIFYIHVGKPENRVLNFSMKEHQLRKAKDIDTIPSCKPKRSYDLIIIIFLENKWSVKSNPTSTRCWLDNANGEMAIQR